MSKLTPEQIAAARAELVPIEAQIVALEDIARDIRERIDTLKIERDGILARHHVADDHQDCVGCGKAIIGDEAAHHYRDGPVACVGCAPTYAESAKEIADQLLSCESPDDRSELSRALANVRAHIAAGDGDKKHVW